MHATQIVLAVALIQIALIVFLKTEISLIYAHARLNIILNLTTIALSVQLTASHAQTQQTVKLAFL